MELIQWTDKEDFISSMPDNVVTNILDRLPLQDAVGTSILSRNWRFNWTMLSQLVFDEKFFACLLETEHENNCRRIVSRLLLHIKGAITKFVLHIDEGLLDDEDINYLILFLSNKGVKNITLCKGNSRLLKLPTHLFSCLELKHLVLFRCWFDPPARFPGFPNLVSLELCRVKFEMGKLGEFFSRCPLLENLDLGFNFPLGKVKLAEIAKLANLKILSLILSNLDFRMITSLSNIFELVGSFPKLQELDLNFISCKLIEDSAEKRCFPNLYTLQITTSESDAVPTHASCSPEVDYDTVGPLQLRTVVFKYFIGSENEVCLIKYLLACSPFLKRIVIHPHLHLESDEKMMFAMELLKIHRASPVAEIHLCRF